MQPLRRTLMLPVIIVMVFAAIIPVQRHLSRIGGTRAALDNVSLVPNSDIVKPWLLGFHTVYADMLWIKTVLYFGDHYAGDRDFSYLTALLDITTKLNPHLYQPYEFAALMLPDVGNDPMSAKIIVNRGLCTPGVERWQLWFYLGMIYYEYDHDGVAAARCFERAAKTPGAPVEKLATLTATFYDRAGYTAHALEFLTFLYETSQNNEVKKRVAEKMAQLKKSAGEQLR